MAKPTPGEFLRMFFGKGRWKVTVPALVFVGVYEHFVPGTIEKWMTYVWREFFSPVVSLLLTILIMYMVLVFLCNQLTGKKGKKGGWL